MKPGKFGAAPPHGGSFHSHKAYGKAYPTKLKQAARKDQGEKRINRETSIKETYRARAASVRERRQGRWRSYAASRRGNP
jgi:hypothetical protein